MIKFKNQDPKGILHNKTVVFKFKIQNCYFQGRRVTGDIHGLSEARSHHINTIDVRLHDSLRGTILSKSNFKM